MKVPVFILCVLFSGRICEAQFKIYVENGYGSYFMSNMHDVQNEFISNSGLPLVRVSSFPAYLNYGINAGLSLRSSWEIGSTYRYYSTGGRIDYSDYSGFARIDQLLHSYSFGIYASKGVNKSLKWPIAINLNISRQHTTAAFQYNLQLTNDDPNLDDLSLEGNAWGAQVSLVVTHPIKKGFFVFGRTGIEAFANKELRVDNKNETTWKADWSGARIALGVGYSFKKQKENDN